MLHKISASVFKVYMRQMNFMFRIGFLSTRYLIYADTLESQKIWSISGCISDKR